MSDLMTLEEVAEAARVSISTVRHWRLNKSTTIPFGRVGRRVMARRADVEAWIDSQLQTS